MVDAHSSSDIISLFIGFWHQADTLASAIVVLLFMIFALCTILFGYKLVILLFYRKKEPEVVSNFWRAESLTAAIDFLATTPGGRWHNQLLYQAVTAANWKKSQEAKGISMMLPLSDWVLRHLRQGLSIAQQSLNSGIHVIRVTVVLSILLSVLGSVWNIVMILKFSANADSLLLPLARTSIPLLIGLCCSIVLWVYYNILCILHQSVIAKLENFMIDVYDFLLAELS